MTLNSYAKKTEHLKGLHRGFPIVIVGNAPSLARTDMAKFSKIPTIGCNRILQHPTFRPTYLVGCDRRPYVEETKNGNFQRYADTVNMLFSTTIYDPAIKCYDTSPEPQPEFRWYPWRVGFSGSPFNWESFDKDMCSFGSITGPMLQMAVIMGARAIGIVGVDMQAPKTGNSIHFYQNEGAWEGYKSLKKLEPGGNVVRDKSVELYKKAFMVLDGMGIEVSNLNPDPDTRFSKLFGRVDIDEFLDANL